jgi:hypothetical protein
MAGTVVTSIVKNDTTSPPTFQNSAATEVGTLCRAWVNFNGVGTVAIRASFNVSSITDAGSGQYTVNFTNALTDTNYCVIYSNSALNDTGFDAAGGARQFQMIRARATTSCGVQGITDGGGLEDANANCVAIFR